MKKEHLRSGILMASLGLACVSLTGACTNESGGLSEQEITEACVRLAACGVPYTSALGECILNVARGSTVDSTVSDRVCCLAGAPANDCAGVMRCLDSDIRRVPGGCGGMLSSCLGDRVRSCDDDFFTNGDGLETVDTCTGGERCIVGDYGAACGVSACTSSSTSACQGNDYSYCSFFGVVSILRCSGPTACGSYNGGGGASYGCVGTGRSCDRSTCDGSVLVECSGNRESLRYDCASVGLECREDMYGASCAPRVSECTPEEGRCVGASIEYCAYRGERQLYDCEANGFGGCIDPDLGPPRCTVPGWDLQEL